MKPRHVLHLADIHIRSGSSGKCRKSEYEAVVACTLRLADDLASAGPLLTVVAGDVMHDRSTLDPHSINIFRTLFVGLSERGTVVVIQGNHDHHPMHGDAVSPHDILGSLLDLASLPRIIYLSKSGHYTVEGIGFGVLTVHDAVPEGESRSGTYDMPGYPDPDAGASFNVALFHGTVQGCRCDSGAVTGRGAPMAMFSGYDAVMLGDQHLQQIGNHVVGPDGELQISGDKSAPTWAYPGSLLQQGHGESLWNHGAIVWDLERRTLRPVHVRNPRGFVTLQDANLYYDGAWQPLCRHLEDPDFPTAVNVRTKGDASLALALLESKDVAVANAVRPTRHAPADRDAAETRKASDWRVAILDMGIDISDVMEAAYLPSFTERVVKDIALTRNARLDKMAAVVRASCAASRAPVRPTRLTWEWMMCFGTGNSVAILGDDGVILVSAENGAGKSSFIEILLYAFFGEGVPTRCCRENSAAMINTSMPAGASAMAEIEFAQNGVEYRITRRWALSAKDASKAVCKSAEVCKTDGAKSVVLCKGRVAVDEWVASNVCTASDFLAGPVLSQGGDGDVLNLSAKEMATLLERAFGLSGIDSLCDLVNEGINAHKQVVARIDMLCNGVTRDAYDAAERAYAAATDAATELRKLLDELPSRCVSASVEELAAARRLSEKLKDCPDYSSREHAVYEAQLSELKSVILPTSDELPFKRTSCGEDLDPRVLSSLWARYKKINQMSWSHAELRDAGVVEGDEAAIRRDIRDAQSRVATAEKAVDKYESDLRAAVRAVADEGAARTAFAAKVLQEHCDATDWQHGDRSEALLGYILAPAKAFWPTTEAIRRAIAFPEDVLAKDSLFDAVSALGGERPAHDDAETASAMTLTRNAAQDVARLESKLATTIEELGFARADLDASLGALDMIDPEASAKARLLRELDAAWAPISAVDFAAVREKTSAAIAVCEAQVRIQKNARKKKVSQQMLADQDVAQQRAALTAALKDVSLEEASLEWGRVRSAKTVLCDLDAAALCRARTSVLQDAATRLKSAKAWLYKERVAPKIQADVNAVISKVEPTLGIVCVVNDDGGVAWLVRDRGRTIGTHKASGFQRFIVSVAIRVVIGSMIAPCTLQIIDEGFTACDDAHLQMVPALLDWLVREAGIKTVLLVSHLQDLRDAIAKRVDIVPGRPFVA